ncbi:MAG: nuclear transport factor 2 family protein [Bacteroidetes bacterium]|nr:nuclear transport factor 2 family protein [Bacteroidota bacterium]
MTPNEQLIHTLYTAFQQKDHKTMGACYHNAATFHDAVFDLKTGKEIRSMWEMLCRQSRDFSLHYNAVKATEQNGSAHWEAQYTFSKTGRTVLNKIDAAFEFKDGLIIKHTDTFNFYNWSKQALGFNGLLLGWTPFLHNKVKRTAEAGLRAFIKKQNT